MRIDYYLKKTMGYSKQEIKQLLKENHVRINECIVNKANESVNGNVYVNGNRIEVPVHFYVMLYKPKGYISDIHGKDSIMQLFDCDRKEQLHIMGRLDKDTTGLMILTNDDRLIKEITFPGKHEKEYLVTLKSIAGDLTVLSNGVIIDEDVQCLPASYKKIDDYHVSITIREGRYHQIKKMFLSLGNEVVDLKRVRINQLTLDPDLECGQYRMLSQEEIEKLKGNYHEL